MMSLLHKSGAKCSNQTTFFIQELAADSFKVCTAVGNRFAGKGQKHLLDLSVASVAVSLSFLLLRYQLPVAALDLFIDVDRLDLSWVLLLLCRQVFDEEEAISTGTTV